MSHPFIELLKSKKILLLWTGLALSAFAREINNIAIVWLAIDLVGPNASLLPMTQYAVVFLVSLNAGIFADRLTPRVIMIGADMLSAVVVLATVWWSQTFGLGIVGLYGCAILLAALTAMFQPALLSCVPLVAVTHERIQALNGLFDGTTRLSRLAGPFVAGPMSVLLPVIHFLTVNGLWFVLSALSLCLVGPLGVMTETKPEALSVAKRMLRGVELLREEKDARFALFSNAAALVAWTIGVSLGFPFLVAERGITGLGLQGLGAVAAIGAAYGSGDFLSNLFVVTHRPKRPGRFMFSGYIVLGGGLALVPLPLWLLPEVSWLPSMMLAAFVSGFGGPIFFIPMMTFLQTRLQGANLASVIRLRLAMISAAMMAGAAAGPFMFGGIGAPVAILLAGIALMVIGVWGALNRPDLGRADVTSEVLPSA